MFRVSRDPVTWCGTHLSAPEKRLRFLSLSVPLDGSERTAVTFCFGRRFLFFSPSSLLPLPMQHPSSFEARGAGCAHVPGTIDELTATDTSSSSRPILPLPLLSSSSSATCFTARFELRSVTANSRVLGVVERHVDRGRRSSAARTSPGGTSSIRERSFS